MSRKKSRKKKNSKKGKLPLGLRKWMAKQRAKKHNPKRVRRSKASKAKLRAALHKAGYSIVRKGKKNPRQVVTRTRTIYKTRKVYVNPKRKRSGSSLTAKLLQMRKGKSVRLTKSEAKTARHLFGKRLRTKSA